MRQNDGSRTFNAAHWKMLTTVGLAGGLAAGALVGIRLGRLLNAMVVIAVMNGVIGGVLGSFRLPGCDGCSRNRRGGSPPRLSEWRPGWRWA